MIIDMNYSNVSDVLPEIS